MEDYKPLFSIKIFVNNYSLHIILQKNLHQNYDRNQWYKHPETLQI